MAPVDSLDFYKTFDEGFAGYANSAGSDQAFGAQLDKPLGAPQHGFPPDTSAGNPAFVASGTRDLPDHSEPFQGDSSPLPKIKVSAETAERFRLTHPEAQQMIDKVPDKGRIFVTTTRDLSEKDAAARSSSELGYELSSAKILFIRYVQDNDLHDTSPLVSHDAFGRRVIWPL